MIHRILGMIRSLVILVALLAAAFLVCTTIDPRLTRGKTRGIGTRLPIDATG
jgi:hypothetical protein